MAAVAVYLPGNAPGELRDLEDGDERKKVEGRNNEDEGGMRKMREG